MGRHGGRRCPREEHVSDHLEVPFMLDQTAVERAEWVQANWGFHVVVGADRRRLGLSPYELEWTKAWPRIPAPVPTPRSSSRTLFRRWFRAARTAARPSAWTAGVTTAASPAPARRVTAASANVAGTTAA